MQTLTSKVCLLQITLSLFFPLCANAANLDFYIVYVSSEKLLKNSLKIKLSKSHKIKVYNAGALATADYSGKQKAISKLSTANLILILTEKPLKYFDNHEFENALIVTGDSDADIEGIVAALN